MTGKLDAKSLAVFEELADYDAAWFARVVEISERLLDGGAVPCPLCGEVCGGEDYLTRCDHGDLV